MWRRVLVVWSASRVAVLSLGYLLTVELGWHRALQPWQTRNKQGRVFRYYLSTRELKEYAGASDIPRLPAEQLEAIVIRQLRDILRTPSMVAEITRQAVKFDPALDEAQVSVALLQFDRVWEQLSPDERHRAVRLLIDKIVVRSSRLELRLADLGGLPLARELTEPYAEAACA